MRQNAGSLAVALHRTDNVQQISIVALLSRWCSERLETLVRVMQGVKAGTPAFVAERRIGNHIIEGLECAAVLEFGVGQGIALHDEGCRVVVQDHVHPSQPAGGGILFLTVQRGFDFGLVTHFQQQRTGTAGRVIDGGGAGGFRLTNAGDLRNDAADFGGGVKLAFAFAALSGKVAHQVFIGIA